MPRVCTQTRTYKVKFKDGTVIEYSVMADYEESMKQFEIMLEAQKLEGKVWKPPKEGYIFKFANRTLRTTYIVRNEGNFVLSVTREETEPTSLTWLRELFGGKGL